jgi:glycosyltransferase involved in cell wall biosynthesis
MKKALIVTEVFDPEDFVINDLAKYWIDSGNNLEVLTRNPSYPKGKIFPGYKNRVLQKGIFHGSKVYRILFLPGYQKSTVIKILNYFNYIFWSFWILLFIGKRYDRIFIYQTGPLTNALSAVMLKSFFKWKITIWSQDLWPETVYAFGIKKNKFSHSLLNNLVGFIYKRCDVILVSCKGFIPKIKKYAGANNIHWIPNWTLVDGMVKSKAKLPGNFNFTFAGNIGKVQNLDKVVRAFGKVSSNGDKVVLNIIGDGSYFNELKDITDKEYIPNVNFTGRLPLQEMSAYFEASDVLIISLIDVPIYEIMLPSKFQAYLTSGRPIFSIVKGELTALTNEYEIGLTADPNDEMDICKTFEKFLKEPKDSLRQMALNCKSLNQSQFYKPKLINSVSDIFWK